MILKVDGGLNPYSVQTLAMMFFPGVKFPQDEVPAPGVPEVYVRTEQRGSAFHAEAVILLDGTETRGDALVPVEIGFDADHAEQTAAGIAFFRAASALTGFSPPWGVLTGVRPAKIASERFRAGDSPAQAADWIAAHYGTTPRKASLAAAVADAERHLIRPEMVDECSVYIGIPFCPTRCAYCSFVSYTTPRLLSLIPDYLNALLTNVRTVFATIRKLGIPVASVYIGGGTPTVLDALQLRRLLDTVADETDVSALREFTLEAGRPDTITAEKLAVAKDHGVGRISVNTQTLNEDVLRAIGREHSTAQFFEAYKTAMDSGIPVVNVDLIAGLPGESAVSFASTVERIAALAPQNVTVHTFCVKKSAEIRWNKDSVYDGEGRVAAEAVDASQRILAEAGYAPYYMYRQKNTVGNLENVGYARPGTEGLYNIYMMEEVHSIFAAGASAVTKFVSPRLPDGTQQIKRVFEPKYPYEYLKFYSPDTAAETARAYTDAALEFYRQYFPAHPV